MALNKRGLQVRSRKSYDSREGDTGKSIFQYPSGVEFFEMKKGSNRISIVPYKVTNKNHPLVRTGELEPDDLDYMMDIWVHRGVGPNNADLVCLKKNYNKPCPCCEQAFEYRDDGKKDEYDDLKASRRVFYNVIDELDENKLKVWEASHYLVEKEIITEAHEGNDDGNITDYTDPDEGMSVKFRGEEETFAGNNYIKPKSFSFVERDSKVTRAIKAAMNSDALVCFDKVMTVLDAEKMNAVLFGGEAAADDDDDDDDRDERPSRPAKSKKAVDDDEDERPTKSKKAVDEDEDDADNAPDADPHEEDVVNQDPECPAGGQFGKSTDKLDECDKCKLWRACSHAQKGKKS